MACLVCKKDYIAKSHKERTCSEACRVENIRNIKNEWYRRNKHKNAEYYQNNKERIKTKAEDYRNLNRDELLERKKKYREKNKDLIKERSKDYTLRSIDKRREYRLKKDFNMSLEEYNTLLKEQNYCCKICGIHESGQKRNLAVDHCRTTGKIRGILCDNCNTSLGLLKESPSILQSAIDYLKNSLKDN